MALISTIQNCAANIQQYRSISDEIISLISIYRGYKPCKLLKTYLPKGKFKCGMPIGVHWDVEYSVN